MIKKVVLMSALLSTVSCTTLVAEKVAIKPEGLLTELLRWPDQAKITDASPELSWALPLNIENQKAYRILVASSNTKLDEGNGDMWDSQKTLSAQTLNIEYAGLALKPNTSYWWKVQIWDEDQRVSSFSDAQQFITGNLGELRKELWPGESKWVQLSNENWVSEDRQTSIFENIAPINTTVINENNYLVEFEKAAFATLNVTITSDKDQTITLYLGERLAEDGLINKNPGHSFIGYEELKLNLKKGTYSYQTEVPPNHSKSPHHQKLAPFYPEVLPFRFAEFNLPENVTVDSATQYALYYPFDDNASSFKSDSDALNQVWDLSKYTLKATPFLGVYADGNRERMPYEADAYIQQLGHYNVDREFSVARYTAKFLLHHASWPTEWNMHMLMIAWQDYMHTGNKEFLAQYYNDLKVKTLHELAREDGLISSKSSKVTSEFLERLHYNGSKFRDIVDWPKGTKPGEKQARNAGATPEGERDGYVFTDYNTVVNAFHFNTLNIMSDIAQVVGNKSDQRWFKNQSLKVKLAMQKHMFDNKRGVFVDGIDTEHASLHANMFALAFDLVPEESLDSLLAHIQSKGMASSVYGAQHLLDGLYKAGAADYALSLMTADHKRSWLNMIKVGSTMTTEAWDEEFKPNLTWNHAWGAAPANIIPRRLMGIKPLKAGFKRFSIMPQPSSLKDIALTIPTISGAINTDLQVNETSGKTLWRMNITVPGGTTAELWLPAEFNSVTLNGTLYKADKSEVIANALRQLITLPTGTYNITAQ